MGQVLRYMGYVLDDVAIDGQTVRGVIIALEDDPKLKRALAATPNRVVLQMLGSFKLFKS